MLRLLCLVSRRELVPALAAGLLAALTGLGLMGASAWLITRASFTPPLYTLALGITCVRACGLARAVFRYLERYLSHRLAFRAYGQLQQEVYARAEAALPLLTGQAAQGDWLERLLSGCAVLRDSYVRALLPLTVTALLTGTGCWALALLSLPAACLLALVYLIHFLCWPLLPVQTGQAAASYREGLLELTDGGEEIITAGSSALYLKDLSQKARSYQADTAKQEQRLDWLEALLALLRAAGLTLLLALLYGAVRTGQLTGIELAVWLLLLLTLFQDYTALLPALRQLRQARPLLSCISPAVPPAPGNPPKEALSPAAAGTGICLLEVKDLNFSYPNRAPLFQGLSFTVNSGQHTAIIGESGRGKTTLAYLLAGLYTGQRPVLLQGQALDRPRPDLLAACLQGCYVFSPSVRDNFLGLYPGITEAEILDCLTCAQFLPVLEALPRGLDEALEADAGKLSGGERLRLLTALALASPAPLLLLDEPTASLDKKTASALLAALFDRASERGQTLLIITHDLPQLDRFAQVIKL